MCIGWLWWNLRSILKIAFSKRNVISASWVPRKTNKVRLLVTLSQHWKDLWILNIEKTWMKLSRLRLLTRSNLMQGESRSDQGKWAKVWDIYLLFQIIHNMILNSHISHLHLITSFAVWGVWKWVNLRASRPSAARQSWKWRHLTQQGQCVSSIWPLFVCLSDSKYVPSHHNTSTNA